jgi:hypothetical protein
VKRSWWFLRARRITAPPNRVISLSVRIDRSKATVGRIWGLSALPGNGRLAGRKALITVSDSGMGRAAAIAYAREGADVAINYLPNEEPDAQEVIELIKAEDRRNRITIVIGFDGDLVNPDRQCRVTLAVRRPRRHEPS